MSSLACAMVRTYHTRGQGSLDIQAPQSFPRPCHDELAMVDEAGQIPGQPLDRTPSQQPLHTDARNVNNNLEASSAQSHYFRGQVLITIGIPMAFIVQTFHTKIDAVPNRKRAPGRAIKRGDSYETSDARTSPPPHKNNAPHTARLRERLATQIKKDLLATN